MRELTVNTFLTLDGVMQAPGGPEEDPEGGFDHGGWSFGYWDERMQQAMGEAFSRPIDLVLGRKTYEIFAAHWPHTDEPPAELFNAATKYVASTTLKDPDWQNTTVIESDVPERIRALKEEEGPELQVQGSASLIQTLLENRLIDEFRLMIFPLVLGKGKRLFEGGTVPDGLDVVRSETSSTGVIIANYRPGAGIKYGSFAAEEPSEAELERRGAQRG